MDLHFHVDGLVEVSEEIVARSEAYKSAEDRKRYDPGEAEIIFRDRQVELWNRRIQVAAPLVTFVSTVCIRVFLLFCTVHDRESLTRS